MDHATPTLFDPNDGLAPAYQRAAQALAGCETVLVVSHQNPDGDAIGSTLAMCHLLRALGKQATPFNVHPVPHNLRFLPGAEGFAHSLAPDARFDATVLLDCADKHRAGDAFPEHGWADTVVVIDHHTHGDPAFAQVVVRDTSAAAVGEMIFRLARVMGAGMTLDFARACYCSLMTDTGSFRYSATSPTTFRIAAELLQLGVDAWDMTSHIYEDDPVERVRLLGRVLQTLTVSPCGRIASIRIERDVFDGVPNATDDLLDGFINYARRIRGVEVATQLRALPDAVDTYRVSFRSRGRVNVGQLAAAFGGGGHQNAAACTLTGSHDHLFAQLTDALARLIDAPTPSAAP